MTLSFSVLLVLVAFVIYVYDSIVFLYLDEGILTRNLKGRFIYDFAATRFVMIGKLLIVQNLLVPYQPAFRLSWAPPANGIDDGSSAKSIRRMSGRLLRMAPFVWIMSISLFIVAPIGMLILHNWNIVMLALMEFYLSACIIIVMVVIHRKYLNIGIKDIVGIVFESLICPPCGLNIIRKVSWRMKVNYDIVSLSKKLMADDNYRVLLQELNYKIEKELESLDENDMAFARFSSYKDRVQKELT